MKYISLLTILSAFNVFSQQEPLQGMYWNSIEYYNPAATGMEYRHKAILQCRSAAVPSSVTTLTYGARINKLHGGIGVNGSYETGNFNSLTKANLNYSYHLNFGEAVLGIGLQAGINYSNAPAIYYFTEPDVLVPIGKTTAFNSAAGLYFTRKKLTLGASVTQLPQSDIGIYDQKAHYWLTGAYEFNIRENFQITPSALFVTDGVFQNTSFSTRATLYKKIWLGASFRNRDSYSFMAGFDIASKFRIGYNYELTQSRLNNGAGYSTHEFVLGFLLK